MESLLSPKNVVFLLGIIGTIFGVYKYFRDPQVASQQEDALMNQQMKFFVESTEKRFTDIQNTINALQVQVNTHAHTTDSKFNNLSNSMGEMSKQVVRLATIIEERIPKN